jgi:hypothetical protein
MEAENIIFTKGFLIKKRKRRDQELAKAKGK